ncbi:ribonuclease T [Rhodobacteraceae bacterium 2CG4]|uniref:Ribonuclease T n=1 Tax=Halovulum marinum TaxID=2662447 RepID=A0A6L5Z0J1_9RHOB|nr:ribonuclease T [Halovulum marinum]MSU89494.1 ribonuclease T [Halovulum marinum]
MRLLALLIALLPLPAAAFEALDGRLTAVDACAAYLSKNKGTNPGDVRLEPGRDYALLGLNARGGDHYQVLVPGAPVSERRWVPVDCGSRAAAAAPAVPQAPDEARAHVLALSWQPTFCEYRSRVPECERLNAGRLPDASARLSVHGLWPEGTYCGVAPRDRATDEAGRWRDLPRLALTRGTAERLVRAMPGAESQLHRHQWIKHGTCHRGAGGAEEYFTDTLLLWDQLQASQVAAFLHGRSGEYIETGALRAAFDSAFGRGAGDRVQVDCDRDGGRTLIAEVKLYTRGRIDAGADLGDLLRAARPVRRGCGGGILDRAGLQ